MRYVLVAFVRLAVLELKVFSNIQVHDVESECFSNIYKCF